MSIAIHAAPCAAPNCRWLDGKTARTILGFTHYRLLKFAAQGRIRVFSPPGSSVVFSAEDVDRLKAETQGANGLA